MAIHAIGEICYINALSIKKGEYPKRILYLDTANLVEGRVCKMQEMNFTDAPSRAQRRIKNNTILYSSVRPNLKHFGIMTNMPSNVIVSTGFITIDVIDNNCFSPHYIYYLLTQQNIINYLQGIAQNGVSAYPSINPFDIANLKFNFPSLSEQEHIASVLSNIDRKIALNRQINDNLEAMARQLYDYWFVQFDFSDENGRPYKSSGGKMVWNEKLKQNIPMGWIVEDISKIADVYNGATPSTKEERNYGGNIVWITPKDLSDQKSKFVYYGERNITQKGYDSCSTHMLPIGTVLMSSRAPIGLLSIAKSELCTNQGFKSFVPKKETLGSYLYYYILLHIKQIEQLGTGTTFKEISRDDVMTYPILVPKEELLNKWAEFVFPIRVSSLCS